MTCNTDRRPSALCQYESAPIAATVGVFEGEERRRLRSLRHARERCQNDARGLLAEASPGRTENSNAKSSRDFLPPTRVWRRTCARCSRSALCRQSFEKHGSRGFTPHVNSKAPVYRTGSPPGGLHPRACTPLRVAGEPPSATAAAERARPTRVASRESGWRRTHRRGVPKAAPLHLGGPRAPPRGAGCRGSWCARAAPRCAGSVKD